MCGYLFVPVFCCEMCKTGNTCQRGHNFSRILSEVLCCDPAQISHLFPMNKPDCWAVNNLHYYFSHLSACFSLSELMGFVNQRSAEHFLGPSAALSQHCLHSHTRELGKPLGALAVCTLYLSGAVTSVHVPLLTFSQEQKYIPNFLHLQHFNLVCCYPTRAPLWVCCVHWDSPFWSLSWDSLSFLLPFHPVPIRTFLSVCS